MESEAAWIGRDALASVAPSIAVLLDHGPGLGQLKSEREEQALVPLDGTRALPG